MKESWIEVQRSSESGMEQLAKKVKEIIRNRNNAIAVEVYGSGIGRVDEDSVTHDQLEAEALEVSLRYREDLLDVLDGLSVRDEALAIYDAATANDNALDNLSEQLSQLILTSNEHASEIEVYNRQERENHDLASAELPGFLDAKILGNQNNRAKMSEWGTAKLAYEQGDPSRLKALLEDNLRSVEDDSEKLSIERFLRYL